MTSKSFFVLFGLACLALTISAQFQGPEGQEPPPPSFLQGAPESTINEFKQMLANTKTKTDKEINDEVEAWIKRQLKDIQSKYAAFKIEMNELAKEAEAAHQKARNAFTPAARAADEKIMAITMHSTLTSDQKQAQIAKIMESLPESVRNEILKAMQGPQ